MAFPDPGSVSERSEDDIAFVTLAVLIEMKLASAKTAPHRIKDRADVLELIHSQSLGGDFAERLNAYVRPEFDELVRMPRPSDLDRG